MESPRNHKNQHVCGVCVCGVCVWGRVCFIIEHFLFVHESLFTIQMCSEL